MTREIEHLNRDLKLIASPAARAAATRDAKEDGSLPQKDIKKDLAVALKQVGGLVFDCVRSLYGPHDRLKIYVKN